MYSLHLYSCRSFCSSLYHLFCWRRFSPPIHMLMQSEGCAVESLISGCDGTRSYSLDEFRRPRSLGWRTPQKISASAVNTHRTALSFACLLLPAALIGGFHYAFFPAVVIGTSHLWGTQKPFPAGFEFLCHFGFLVYLPLIIIAAVYVLSWRFPFFGGSLSLALCAGLLAVICVFYAILLSTPALAHGLSVQHRWRADPQRRLSSNAFLEHAHER